MLDLFCGAGGAALGYHRAGWVVVGVDLVEHPNYPFAFELGDATTFPLDGFDAVHASPPCQRYAKVTRWRGVADNHPDLLGPTIDRLAAWGGPWVVENVPEAGVEPDVRLCGTMFGQPWRRHRNFWTWPSLFHLTPSCRHRPGDLAFDHKGERAYADAIGCAHMTNLEARQAVPPIYTEHLGARLIEALEGARRQETAR